MNYSIVKLVLGLATNAAIQGKGGGATEIWSVVKNI